jgi:hypothetical protein
MTQDTKYEGISFNTDWISSHTSVSEFISNATHLLVGENQELKLTELYNIVKGTDEKPSKKKGNADGRQ